MQPLLEVLTDKGFFYCHKTGIWLQVYILMLLFPMTYFLILFGQISFSSLKEYWYAGLKFFSFFSRDQQFSFKIGIIFLAFKIKETALFLKLSFIVAFFVNMAKVKSFF